MSRGHRRYLTRIKVQQRLTLVKRLGLQQGTLYVKHREKIAHSPNYMRDGNVRHYVSTKPRKYYKRNVKHEQALLLSLDNEEEYFFDS